MVRSNIVRSSNGREGNAPPPAYGAENDMPPSFDEPLAIQKFDWSKLIMLFASINNGRKVTRFVYSKDALPGFGQYDIEIYFPMLIGTGQKATILGKIDVDELHPKLDFTSYLTVDAIQNNHNQQLQQFQLMQQQQQTEQQMEQSQIQQMQQQID